MGKLKLKLVSLDNNTVWMLFKREGGGQFHTWFDSPPKSIDHVGRGYLENRLNEHLTDKQIKFIKKEYKKQIKEVVECSTE